MVCRRSLTQSPPFIIPFMPDPQAVAAPPPMGELPHRFHLGYGPLIVEGYINIDAVSPHGFEPLEERKLYQVPASNAFVLRHDLCNGLPAKANDLTTIYHSHFLEHLSDQDGKTLLTECHRCLAPGGTLRMAIPDFQLWCSHYVNNDTEFFDWYRRIYLNDNRDRYPTTLSVFSGMIYNWEHRMTYDFQSLSCLLAQIGFDNIRRAQWGVSDAVLNITTLENDPNRKVESLVVECCKPAR